MPKLPNVKGYANNVLKELRQVANSYSVNLDNLSKAKDYPTDSMAPGGKGREYYGAKASQSSKRFEAESGQLLGAVLQGRRYNEQGKQIKAGKAVTKSYKKLPSKGK